MPNFTSESTAPSSIINGADHADSSPLIHDHPLLAAEWIETDGLGGFASGTVSGIRTRTYHALLLSAMAPPSGRMVLVNGFDAWLETPEGVIYLSAQRYAPDVVGPPDRAKVIVFDAEPWPMWTFKGAGGYEVVQELMIPRGSAAVFLRWRVTQSPAETVRLRVRPFLSGRDFHATHHENDHFCFAPELSEGRQIWSPYEGGPKIIAQGTGTYRNEPQWYRQVLYSEERARGLGCLEDLAAPGVYEYELGVGTEAHLAFATMGHESVMGRAFAEVWSQERTRRESFSSSLNRRAMDYLVRRGEGHTIIAGYPWFGDWGRDTFISMRGLCLATNLLDEAKGILLEWALTVSSGLLPNRFSDYDEPPKYNSVDAALWFIIAVNEFLKSGAKVSAADKQKLTAAVEAILEGYSGGTSFGIRMDEDGLLACGVQGMQLTWMDAKVDGHVVTPRIGKPVEIQALWLNALTIGAKITPSWAVHRDRGLASFAAKFWNTECQSLYDVIDVNHEAGVNDGAIRPNQVFAIGGLPLAILDGERARQVMQTVESQLLTPMGLRTLAPGSAGYVGCYEGDAFHRDHAYHQGTVWPWLMGSFVEAWLRVNGDTKANRMIASERFIEPLRQYRENAGMGHLPEIADADAPHRAKGAPFQAWSLGEFIRMERLLSA